MSVHKMDYKTKDGRCWKFRTYYIDIEGKRKFYKSGNYASKKEAEQAEKDYLKKHKEIISSFPLKEFSKEDSDFFAYKVFVL